MNRKDLVDIIAEDMGFKKNEVDATVIAFIEAVKRGMVEDGKVSLTNFGSFSVVRRKARTGVNPKTQEPLEIPAKNVPKFKPSAVLKEAVL